MPSQEQQDPPHIHRSGDGRGIRLVYLDSQEIKNVIYANTKTGDVTFIPQPMRVEFCEAFTCTQRGRVKVVFCNGR